MRLFTKIYKTNEVEEIMTKGGISYNLSTKVFSYNDLNADKFNMLSFLTKELDFFEQLFVKYNEVETESDAKKWVTEEALKRLEKKVRKTEAYIDFVMKDGNVDGAIKTYKVRGIFCPRTNNK